MRLILFRAKLFAYFLSFEFFAGLERKNRENPEFSKSNAAVDCFSNIVWSDFGTSIKTKL